MSTDRGPASSQRGASLAGFAPPSAFHRVIFRVLLDYLSESNARAVMVAVEGATRIRSDRLMPEHVPSVVIQVEKALDLFPVEEAKRAACLQRLKRLGAPTAPPSSGAKGPPRTLLVLVKQEEDIVRARLAAGDACRALGFTELACTKVMTAVSELARNIFRYAGEGQIAVTCLDGAPVGVEIMACDQGPGIKDIAEVLSDNYRSRTGMGAGLKGTRRLMDSFQVESTPGRGTMVVVRKFKS
jgi:serine/threonine-protein kinase RsbT